MAVQAGRFETTAAQMLSDAYELVYAGWCQGAPARDDCGREIEPASAFARSWSAPGALVRVWTRSEAPFEVALAAFERASLALAAAVRDVPQTWNDAEGRTVREVLDALAEATLSLDGEPESLDHVPPFADAATG